MPVAFTAAEHVLMAPEVICLSRKVVQEGQFLAVDVLPYWTSLQNVVRGRNSCFGNLSMKVI